MKQFLVIGAGTFGHILCRHLSKFKCEIMIVDKDPENMEDLLSTVTSAKSGDCKNEEVLKSLGIPDFDVCFVCVGSSFQASLQITSLLKELGAQKVITKAEEDIQAKFLLRNGADQIIYPEDEIAERVATRESSDNIFDFIEVSTDFGIFEITPLQQWIGKSIKTLNFRAKYNLVIFAIKNQSGSLVLPNPDYIFSNSEHVMVVGSKEDVQKITK